MENIEKSPEEIQLDEWFDKTEWLNDDLTNGRISFYAAGMHRADVMKSEIQNLRYRIENMREMICKSLGIEFPPHESVSDQLLIEQLSKESDMWKSIAIETFENIKNLSSFEKRIRIKYGLNKKISLMGEEK
ncbi:MAG: hypothetical protein JO253_08135 [Alphaproteobacteria bacterium]|nr:hypothetical protein [Alphaproteobacteria bacterium]